VSTLLRNIVHVVVEQQTYLNVLYLLLGLPLGIIYFTFLVTGFSLAGGLLIIYAGIPILLLTFAGILLMAEFERVLVRQMLGKGIPSVPGPDVAGAENIWQNLWGRIKFHFRDRITWTALVYLLARFPIGIGTFTIAVTLLALSLWFILMPILAPIQGYNVSPEEADWVSWFVGDWKLDTFAEGLIFTAIGIPLWIGSLHLCNALASFSAEFAQTMLSRRTPD